MKVLVYLTDCRTVFLLESRGRLSQLVGREPWHEESSTRVARGIWNPVTGEYTWFAIPLRHLRKASIAMVEEAPRGLADAHDPGISYALTLLEPRLAVTDPEAAVPS